MSERQTPLTDATWGSGPGGQKGFLEFVRSLERDRAELAEALQTYVLKFPAFRTKPVGAEGSIARIEQQLAIELEDQAKALLARIGGKS